MPMAALGPALGSRSARRSAGARGSAPRPEGGAALRATRWTRPRAGAGGRAGRRRREPGPGCVGAPGDREAADMRIPDARDRGSRRASSGSPGTRSRRSSCSPARPRRGRAARRDAAAASRGERRLHDPAGTPGPRHRHLPRHGRRAGPSTSRSRSSSSCGSWRPGPAASSRGPRSCARSGATTSTAGTRTVDVHVRRLRAKLGPEHEHLIETVRSVGYRAADAED